MSQGALKGAAKGAVWARSGCHTASAAVDGAVDVGKRILAEDGGPAGAADEGLMRTRWRRRRRAHQRGGQKQRVVVVDVGSSEMPEQLSWRQRCHAPPIPLTCSPPSRSVSPSGDRSAVGALHPSGCAVHPPVVGQLGADEAEKTAVWASGGRCRALGWGGGGRRAMRASKQQAGQAAGTAGQGGCRGGGAGQRRKGSRAR